MLASKFPIIVLLLLLSVNGYAQQHVRGDSTHNSCFKHGYLSQINGNWFVSSTEDNSTIQILESTTIYGCTEEIYKLPLPNSLANVPVIILECGENFSQQGGLHVREANIPCY